MLEWLNDTISRVNEFANTHGGLLARLLGYICIAIAVAFAVIAYKEFSSM